MYEDARADVTLCIREARVLRTRRRRLGPSGVVRRTCWGWGSPEKQSAIGSGSLFGERGGLKFQKSIQTNPFEDLTAELLQFSPAPRDPKVASSDVAARLRILEALDSSPELDLGFSGYSSAFPCPIRSHIHSPCPPSPATPPSLPSPTHFVPELPCEENEGSQRGARTRGRSRATKALWRSGIKSASPSTTGRDAVAGAAI